MWRWRSYEEAYRNQNELRHYGIKGMKWGVRRTKEELAHDRHSIEVRIARKLRKPFRTPNGTMVRALSEHALDRSQEESRPVTVEGILDALKNPLNGDKLKMRIDEHGRRSQRYIGEYATANLDPDNGVIATVWKTGHKTVNKYKKG